MGHKGAAIMYSFAQRNRLRTGERPQEDFRKLGENERTGMETRGKVANSQGTENKELEESIARE